MTMLRRLFVLIVFALAAAGCGGGSGTTPGGPGPAPTTAPKPPVGTASVTFSIAVPSRVMSAQRQPRYVSPATATVQVAVNGGVPQTFPVSGGAPCSSTAQPPASGTCIIASVQAPLGDDTFTVRLLDASGHTLSGGTVQQTILPGQTNTVHITFDGVVAALRVALTKPTPPTGATTRLGVVVTPLDAAGYTIVGAPGALPSVTLTDDDTSGATGLYLRGDGDCANAMYVTPGPSVVMTAVTVSGLSFYVTACLVYRGQALPNGATITAAIPSGPFATTKLTPVAPPASGGAWVLGQDTANNNGNALRHYSPSYALLASISGANTHVAGAYGLAVDAASGNVWIPSDLHFTAGSSSTDGTWDGYLYMFPPSASGNVAPSSSTHFTGIPAQIGQDRSLGTFPDSLEFVALDGAGNAFVLKYNVARGRCEVWRFPLAGGTVAAVKAADCSDQTVPVQAHFGYPYGMLIDRGFVYVGVPIDTYFTGAHVVRYTIGGGGTLTRDAVLTIISGNASHMGVDAAGNLLVSASSWQSGPPTVAGRFPAADFVSGQTTIGALTEYVSRPPVAEDAAGTVYSVFPNFNSIYVSLAKPVPSSGNSLSAQPSTIETQSSANIVVSESGYTGTFSELDDCGAIATITPPAASGPSANFTVTAKVQTAGTCHVTFNDGQQTATVAVGVTSTTVTGSSRKRSQ